MPRRLIRHALIHIFLTLCFFLPGGWLWNRVDPHLAGLPFSVFVETLLLPLFIALNFLVLLWACWQDDQSHMQQLSQDLEITSESETEDIRNT